MLEKIKCKVVGHSWDGCKCTRCGELRDEAHKFQPIEDKCKQQCSMCEKIENLPHQWDNDKCVRCGLVKNFASKYLSFLHLEKKNNKLILGLSSVMIIIFIFIGVMVALEPETPSDVADTVIPPVVSESVSIPSPEVSIAPSSTPAQEIETSSDGEQKNSDSSGAERNPSGVSSWDGEHTELKKLIKKKLNDENSYKHVNTRWRYIENSTTRDEINALLSGIGWNSKVSIGDFVLFIDFSAKNAYNATMKNTAYGIEYKNGIVELLGIQ